jgi:hypothetical protein
MKVFETERGGAIDEISNLAVLRMDIPRIILQNSGYI